VARPRRLAILAGCALPRRSALWSGWRSKGSLPWPPAVTAAFWAGYRQRLERIEPLAQVLYSLWVDWFGDRSTVDVAFTAVIGDEVGALREQGRLRELAAGPLHCRAARVLDHSGPVPWHRKRDVLAAVATVPELAPEPAITTSTASCGAGSSRRDRRQTWRSASSWDGLRHGRSLGTDPPVMVAGPGDRALCDRR
jgi:hypothetical protein